MAKARGPKTALNDELAAEICKHLEAGLYRSTVAELVGIRAATLSDWMGKAREPYISFQKLVREAEAKAEQAQLAKVTGSPDPADAKWYLARKHPDRWAETRRVDVSGRLDMGLKLDANALSNPDARAHIAALTSILFAGSDTEPDAASPDGDE